jgi:hypothetical protein
MNPCHPGCKPVSTSNITRVQNANMFVDTHSEKLFHPSTARPIGLQTAMTHIEPNDGKRGCVTVGVLAMAASRIAGIRYTASLAMLAPFIAAWMAVILLVAYVPELVLGLPRLRK